VVVPIVRTFPRSESNKGQVPCLSHSDICLDGWMKDVEVSQRNEDSEDLGRAFLLKFVPYQDNSDQTAMWVWSAC
jgi:hypothetical protein